jgi:hypothetical protein
LEGALAAVGLSAILPRLIGEKIDFKIMKEMSDCEFSRIGVETIGDRSRLRQIATGGSDTVHTSHSSTPAPSATGNCNQDKFYEEI